MGLVLVVLGGLLALGGSRSYSLYFTPEEAADLAILGAEAEEGGGQTPSPEASELLAKALNVWAIAGKKKKRAPLSDFNTHPSQKRWGVKFKRYGMDSPGRLERILEGIRHMRVAKKAWDDAGQRLGADSLSASVLDRFAQGKRRSKILLG